MDLIEILSRLDQGAFAPGDVVESKDRDTFTILATGLVEIKFSDGEIQVWEQVTSCV